MFKNLVKSATAELFEIIRDREYPYESFDEMAIDEILRIHEDLMQLKTDEYIDYLSEIDNEDTDYNNAQQIIDDLVEIREYDSSFHANEVYTSIDTNEYTLHTYGVIDKGKLKTYYRIHDEFCNAWLFSDRGCIEDKTYTLVNGAEAINFAFSDNICTFTSKDYKK